MLGGTSTETNPNATWLNSRGMWLSYCFGVLLIHFALLSFPILSLAWSWTLTNLIHNTVMFIVLHFVKGTPWETIDQGDVRDLTHWEQIDNGVQFTATRKFLTVIPIILFFLASFYTKYDSFHFLINFTSLLTVIIPKLPQLHKVRLFNINKY